MKRPNLLQFLLSFFEDRKPKHAEREQSGNAGSTSSQPIFVSASNSTGHEKPVKLTKLFSEKAAPAEHHKLVDLGTPITGATKPLSPVSSQQPVAAGTSYSGFPSASYSGFPSSSYSGFPSSYSGFPVASQGGVTDSSYGGFPTTSYGGFPSASYSGFPGSSSQPNTVAAAGNQTGSTSGWGDGTTTAPDPTAGIFEVPSQTNTDPLNIKTGKS